MMHDFPDTGELIIVERVEHEPVYTRNSTLPWVIAALVGFGLLFATIIPRVDFAEMGEMARAWTGSGQGSETKKLAPEMQALLNETLAGKPALAEEGTAAEQLNEAMPLSTLPVEAARPFVMPYDSIPIADRALRCLTQAVYYEAGFEPMEGRHAVAQVILNRMRHPAYPNSVCGVVYQGSSRPGCQFSFTCDGSLYRAPDPKAWAVARDVAQQALSGKVTSAVGMATHYHANYVSPYWAPKLTKINKIGAHIFYRWPGNWGRPGAFTDGYSGKEFIPALSSLANINAGKLGMDGEELLEEAATAPAALPPDPTDRRAENDLGGRMDVSKGWKLTIPSPTESRGAYERAQMSQGTIAAPATVAGATP
ncbi:cell wall hydrolase [Sphingorhabdus pulchriflava]|uniref:Cell wall hydrolase n=1 Tax=Sphingorhabdus pulchriflava TaxID=2292257 RepID=A0A371B276_9SPHN|nr:cell wall hydrolase [Sphingorhabdus pulchriflava]RDV01695.1 cell wall hydrolase [Sphingorhabdus pulchriflava]